jgi:hypothetical protein
LLIDRKRKKNACFFVNNRGELQLAPPAEQAWTIMAMNTQYGFTNRVSARSDQNFRFLYTIQGKSRTATPAVPEKISLRRKIRYP